MRLTDHFDGIYVVNLPERTDRRREMEAELERVGMKEKTEFFPAIRPSQAGEWPSIGALGCFLSHYEILKKAKAQGQQRLLVLEDDLAIDPKLAVHEARLTAELEQTDWDLVYLGHVHQTTGDASVRLERAPSDLALRTTHFYGINGPAMIERVIAFLELVQSRPPGHPDGGPMHLDGAYSTFRAQNPEVVTLMATPSLGHQRSSQSDVTPKWFDEIAGLRLIVRVARRARKWAKRLRALTTSAGSLR